MLEIICHWRFCARRALLWSSFLRNPQSYACTYMGEMDAILQDFRLGSRKLHSQSSTISTLLTTTEAVVFY